jgi:MoaA/NifB/PqqE/SkfB family radical SAM enzyme
MQIKMPHSLEQVFCNVPWVEVHINADGTYHSCGAQPNTVSGTLAATVNNVHRMTIPEWINSSHQCRARLKKLKGEPEDLCGMCYAEDRSGSSSKRTNENLKSKISNLNFAKTYRTTPDRAMFDHSTTTGETDNLRPYSYHISLGNECNLSCKMCNPTASSRLAVELIQEGTYSGPARMNWTTDPVAWGHVVDYICSTQDLRFVHIIGGEPLMNIRFEDLVDRLISAGKTDIYLGFTTNGTIIDVPLIKKLNAFRHVDIGISIEAVGQLNDLIRNGSSTQQVLDNIDTYLQHRSESHVYVTLRAVPSALSVHNLDDLYRWCISRKLDVMTNMLNWPKYQRISNLPQDVKNRLLNQYSQWEYSEPMPGISNPRDPNRFREHIDNEIRAVINCLQQANVAEETEILYKNLEKWGWFNYPEIKNYFFVK